MADIIKLLPDSVANQIAAGEVIQRPASVVKELVENAIDAKAKNIKIIVKDSGKTLIQVVDDGKGMSETDARMAFERHATSKINSADDLFGLTTMGFRGEALASIAAIAIVELKTKKENDELGTYILISRSKVSKQETISCSPGSNFIVKNLFFNVPARRKFLKSNATELKHIINEIYRVALANPEVGFVLNHNDAEIFNLPISNHKQRISNIFGRPIGNSLIPVRVDNQMATIHGFVSTPDIARKGDELEFFFVNNRYMRHPYFHKAVLTAYEQIIPSDVMPPYFLYFDVDPKSIDVNIHPTKTEIKFEHANALFLIVKSAVKEALGKHNIVPSLDFDMEGSFEIPVMSKATSANQPSVSVDPHYNPFEMENRYPHKPVTQDPLLDDDNLENWEQLYENFEKQEEDELDQFSTQDSSFKFLQSPRQPQMLAGFSEPMLVQRFFFQLKGKYILTPVKSGLMIIDQKRAHERILYERFVAQYHRNEGVSQQVLFPVKVELPVDDAALLREIMSDLNKIGFDVREFGSATFVIYGFPGNLESDPKETLYNLLFYYKSTSADIKNDYYESLAKGLAKITSINYGKNMNTEEMREIVDELFACQVPNFSPDGKSIINTLTLDEIEKKLN
jgi:DNA mismatch repair protein MutL